MMEFICDDDLAISEKLKGTFGLAFDVITIPGLVADRDAPDKPNIEDAVVISLELAVGGGICCDCCCND
ncbi:unnamed protein product [Ambrosiozyma monospora]|uniref:Unnamed protein product n=1 Tax=Ambrosiozyma monospora TaxID=43982 RepID=A0A9W6T636_AMBMO|nr:unnamed protein product [Ambrosiozyma monospora]